MLDHDRLLSVLRYEKDTGIFFWKIRPARNVFVGDVAGNLNRGYVSITIDKKVYKAHRLAWFYIYGKWPQKQIDHINGNPSDNRISNLRDVTDSINRQNLHKASKNNLSGLLGVCKARKKFSALIKKNGVTKYLGTFDNPEDAHNAYLKAKALIHSDAYICRTK